jgi:acyl-CoA dehydrogenase
VTASPTITDPHPFALSPDHAQMQTDAREVAAGFAPQAREIRQHLLDHSALHPELWSEFCGRGWPALLVPRDHGGTPGGLAGLTVVLEAFAAHNIVLWMPALTTAIAQAIAAAGPDPARQRWLPRIAAGDTLMAMATTEPQAGHNLFRVSTEIRRDADHFIVNGFKRVTSGLDTAQRVLVFGRPPKTSGNGPAGYTTILVDPHAAGVTMTEVPMRHREGVRQYELRLDDVRVPDDELIGVEGQGLAAVWPFTHVERVLTAAICLGVADYAINRSVQRASQRVVSGTSPIGADQAIAHPLAALHSRLQAARLLVYRTAARFDVGADDGAVAGDANMAKLLTADLAFEAVDHAMRVMGADAWDERHGWLDIYLDARLSRTGPVSNEFALNYVASHVLGLPAHT